MALAISWADSRPATALRRSLTRGLEAASRHVRLTAILSVCLICACFAAATYLQMRRDYAHALALADAYTSAQARVLAASTAQSLDRLAALGSAYVNAVDGASAADMVQAADSDRVLNIALADADGHFVTAMKGQPLAANPLPRYVLDEARQGRAIVAFSDPAIGSSPMTLVYRADQETPARYIVMPLNPDSLLPPRALGQTALMTRGGKTLALGQGWEMPPPAYALRSDGNNGTLRYVEYGDVRRIVALSPVAGWPLAAATSVRGSDALGTWYGSIPLYLFVILGPAIAGAALAALLVREFERADRARSALVAVKAIGESQVPEPDHALLGRLADAERRADDAERAKSEFIAHMSHELRTPLNAIIGFAEVIQTGFYGPPGHDKYAEYAGDIAQAGRDLHRRIGEILEFGAVSAERQPLKLGPVDVGAVAAACAAQAQGAALARRIAITSEIAPLPPARADEAAVRRILGVILSNAVRYTPEGGAICVSARKDEDTIVIVVHDNGTGFSAEESDRAGEPFLRFPRPGSGEPAGLGLGLAMAMGLARNMGGALRLAGAAGEGTWAELRLPVAAAA